MLTYLSKIKQIRGMKRLIEITLIVAVFFAVKSYSQRDLVQDNLPYFESTLLGGQKFVSNNLDNKPLLLHFWANWCPVCEMEKESIESLSKDYRVVSVAMKSGTNMEVEQYMKENQLSFPTIIDEHGKLAEKFGINGVPVSFIVRPNGKIAFSEIGYTTELGLRIRLWLAEE